MVTASNTPRRVRPRPAPARPRGGGRARGGRARRRARRNGDKPARGRIWGRGGQMWGPRPARGAVEPVARRETRPIKYRSKRVQTGQKRVKNGSSAGWKTGGQGPGAPRQRPAHCCPSRCIRCGEVWQHGRRDGGASHAARRASGACDCDPPPPARAAAARGRGAEQNGRGLERAAGSAPGGDGRDELPEHRARGGRGGSDDGKAAVRARRAVAVAAEEEVPAPPGGG